MTTKNFTTRNGEDNSVEILLQPLNRMLGFVSDDGEFFFDTVGEQIMIHPEDFQELLDLVKSVIREKDLK